MNCSLGYSRGIFSMFHFVNCTKWIAEVGKIKDILIFVGHFLHFPEDFDAVCVDDGSKIHTRNEWSDCMFKHLVEEVE